MAARCGDAIANEREPWLRCFHRFQGRQRTPLLPEQWAASSGVQAGGAGFATHSVSYVVTPVRGGSETLKGASVATCAYQSNSLGWAGSTARFPNIPANPKPSLPAKTTAPWASRAVVVQLTIQPSPCVTEIFAWYQLPATPSLQNDCGAPRSRRVRATIASHSSSACTSRPRRRLAPQAPDAPQAGHFADPSQATRPLYR